MTPEEERTLGELIKTTNTINRKVEWLQAVTCIALAVALASWIFPGLTDWFGAGWAYAGSILAGVLTWWVLALVTG